MTAKPFFEIHPESGSWILTDIGQPVARFNSLLAAEQTHRDFVNGYARAIEHDMDDLERGMEME
jgi:hypothetical protein